ncbi:hypothetical protein MLAC_20730 [Mycobacterium lacus]|uniref:Uncharacterized protein n=1 Tax=Mycobacterium lacus TaxID=169765 RepID=A0A7I7NKD5_9MYCO|nr:hypothetical protein MLAC_20730 [Mycobacterium lacus]
MLDPQHGDDLTYGPLHQGVRGARESVYGRLAGLWQARRRVTGADCDMRDARTLLVDVENVLLEAGATAGIEQAYARAQRRAMAAAVVAQIRGDELGVDAQRDAVQRAATDALHALLMLLTDR